MTPTACYVRCLGDSFELVIDAVTVAISKAPAGTELRGVVEITRQEAERVLALLVYDRIGISIGLVVQPTERR